jgi:phosphoglucosamine mutase
MRVTGSNLGGEPSGHILLPHLTRSGDGLIAALQILGVMCRTGKTASALLNQFTAVPQKLVNVRDIDKAVLIEASIIQTVAAVEAELGDKGRVILRPSGTEPLIRIMVEALDEVALDKAMEKLVTAIESYRAD